LVVAYPDSRLLLLDLKFCLGKVHQKDQVIETFSKSLQKRLLHVGASTSDIITQFLSTMTCLKLLFAENCDEITNLLKHYLSKRKDSVRKILERIVDSIQDLEQVQVSDEFGLLLGIFGDKSIFFKEFQKIIASNLIESINFNIENQVSFFDIDT
jgi:hypothetical protein